MALIQTVHLSMANFKSAPVVPAVQNDTDRQVKMIVDDFDLTSGMTGKIAFQRSDGTHYETSATLNTSDNSFTADIDQALTQPGRTMVQLKVTDTLTVSTFSFVIFVEQDNSGTVTPQEGIDLVSAVQAAEDAADRAESAAETLELDATLTSATKAAQAKAVGDEIGELKSALNEANDAIEDDAEIIYSVGAELSQGTPASGKLNDAGYSETNSNYIIKKYGLANINKVKIISDDHFQFQNAAGIPSSGTQNKVGITYGAGEFIRTVPPGASYLMVSTLANGGTGMAYKVTSDIKTDFDVFASKTGENISKLAEDIAYSPETKTVTNNYYNILSNALFYGKTYVVKVTTATAGIYAVKAGTAASSGSMVDTLLNDTAFKANETQIIIYKPTAANIKYFRISSDAITWSVSVYEMIGTNDIITKTYTFGDGYAIAHGITSAVSVDPNNVTKLTVSSQSDLAPANVHIAMRMRKSNVANKMLIFEKVKFVWSDNTEKDVTSLLKIFAANSFSYTDTMLDLGKLYDADKVLEDYTGSGASIYFTIPTSSTFDPTHFYQDGGYWHIDACTVYVTGFVYDKSTGVASKAIASMLLSNGMTGEEIDERLDSLENGGAGIKDYALIAYGDSLTEGAGATDAEHNYSAVCRDALGAKNRASFGYGGSPSKEVAFTAGAISGYIPPSTRSFSLKYADYTTNIEIKRNKLNNKVVLIDGQEYTISQTGDTAYSLPEAYTPADYYKPVVVKNSRYTADIYIIWIGTNDNGMQWDIVDAMIAKLPHKNYVVMGLTRLGTDTSLQDEQKAYMLYGSHYFNTRVQIINNAFQVLNETPTSADTEAMSAGLMPPSLLLYDKIHFNDDGYEAIGKLLAEHIKSLGYYYQKAE